MEKTPLLQIQVGWYRIEFGRFHKKLSCFQDYRDLQMRTHANSEDLEYNTDVLLSKFCIPKSRLYMNGLNIGSENKANDSLVG